MNERGLEWFVKSTFEEERVGTELRAMADDARIPLQFAPGEGLVVHKDEAARLLEEKVDLALEEPRVPTVVEPRPQRPLSAPRRARVALVEK